MATFSIEIADEDIERVVTAFCANYHYDVQVSNPSDYSVFDPLNPSAPDPPTMIDNPETPYQFSNRMVREYIKNNTSIYEKRLVQREALTNLNSAPIVNDPAV